MVFYILMFKFSVMRREVKWLKLNLTQIIANTSSESYRNYILKSYLERYCKFQVGDYKIGICIATSVNII
jgi:hypothetical protein